MISQTDLFDEPENLRTLILKLDLRPLAINIEEKFGDLLNPPPDGVYSFRQVEPVLIPGRKYYVCKDAANVAPAEHANHVANKRLRYTRQPNKLLIEVPDWHSTWKTINEALYNEMGEVIISASYMKDKAKLLSDKPILPYRGMRMAHLIYDRAIDTRITWPHMHIDHLYLIQQELLPGAYVEDHRATEPLEELDIHLDPFHLLAQEYTFDFTEGHPYHLFSSKLTGSTLTLTRYQDYRVLAWHRDQREKQQAEQERNRC